MSDVLRPWILSYLHARAEAGGDTGEFDKLKSKKVQIIQFTTDGTQSVHDGQIWAQISDKASYVDVRILPASVTAHESEHKERITKVKFGTFFVDKIRPVIERIPVFRNGWSLTEPRLSLEVELRFIGGRGAGQIFGTPTHVWDDEKILTWEKLLRESASSPTKPHEKVQPNGHSKPRSTSTTNSRVSAPVGTTVPPLSSRSPTNVDDMEPLKAWNLRYWGVAEMKLPADIGQDPPEDQLEQLRKIERDLAAARSKRKDARHRTAQDQPVTPPPKGNACSSVNARFRIPKAQPDDVLVASQVSSAVSQWSVSVKNDPGDDGSTASQVLGTQEDEQQDDGDDEEEDPEEEEEVEYELEDEDEEDAPKTGLSWNDDEVDELDEDDIPPHTSSQNTSSDTTERPVAGLGIIDYAQYATQLPMSGGILSSSPGKEEVPESQPLRAGPSTPSPSQLLSHAYSQMLPTPIREGGDAREPEVPLVPKDESVSPEQPAIPTPPAPVSSPFLATQAPRPVSPPSSSMPFPPTPSQRHAQTPSQRHRQAALGPDRSPITPSRLPPSPTQLSSIRLTDPSGESQSQSAGAGPSGSGSGSNTQSQDQGNAPSASAAPPAPSNPTGEHDATAWKSPSFRRRTSEPGPSEPRKRPTKPAEPSPPAPAAKPASPPDEHYRDDHDYQGYLAARLGLPADWNREVAGEHAAPRPAATVSPRRPRMIAEVVIETPSPSQKSRAKPAMRSEWRSDPNARQGLQARIEEASERLRGDKRRAGTEEVGERADKKRRISPGQKASSAAPQAVDEGASADVEGESSSLAHVQKADAGAPKAPPRSPELPEASSKPDPSDRPPRNSSPSPHPHARHETTIYGHQIALTKATDRSGIFSKRKRAPNSPFASSDEDEGRENDKDTEEARKAAAARRLKEVANARFRFAKKGEGSPPPTKVVRRARTAQELAREVAAAVGGPVRAAERVLGREGVMEDAAGPSSRADLPVSQSRAPEPLRSRPPTMQPQPPSPPPAQEDIDMNPSLPERGFSPAPPPPPPAPVRVAQAAWASSSRPAPFVPVPKAPSDRPGPSLAVPPHAQAPRPPRQAQVRTGPPLAGLFQLSLELPPEDRRICQTLKEVNELIRVVDEWRASMAE